jgi:DNA repair protein RadD
VSRCAAGDALVITLRPYQQRAVDSIRESYRTGHRAPLLVLPTGAGKTVTFASIVHGAAGKGNRVAILAHRVELIEQIAAALQDFGLHPGFVAAGYEDGSRSQVVVGSTQTVLRRLSRMPEPNLVIIDEAHHCVGGNTWGKILAAWPNARRLGVTATPRRPSGEPLRECFDDLVIGPTVSELTDGGFLAPARIFAPPTVDTSQLHIRAGEFVPADVKKAMDKPTITGDAISHYTKLAAGKRAVCFCYSIEHSRAMAAAFRNSGYAAVHMDGGLDRTVRRDMLRDFHASRIQIICSVDLFSEGLDAPGIEVGILLRPTASEVIYLQQVGRVLRTAPGKTEAILLDHTGNVQRFGLPTDDRQWTLDGREPGKRRATKPEVSIRVCANCFSANRAGPPRCAVCGEPYPVDAREVQQQDGELVEIAAAAARRDARQQQGRAQTLEDLLEVARQRNYRPEWAHAIWRARQQKQVRA